MKVEILHRVVDLVTGIMVCLQSLEDPAVEPRVQRIAKVQQRAESVVAVLSNDASKTAPRCIELSRERTDIDATF